MSAENPISASYAQSVTAVDGYAYGVVGADICVFGDGVPVYVLEKWRGPIESDPEWLREMPSRMLHSRHAVVTFTGRAEELDALVRWRDTGPRLALRWLHGPGGQGKSRIGDQLAAMSVAAGWKVVTATHGPGAVLPPPGSQDLRLGGATGLLVIVDYADRWPHTDLAWLLSNALLHQVGVPTRILMLARDRDTWMAVRGAVSTWLQAGLSAQALEELPDDTGSRQEMFDAARDAFAGRYAEVDPRRAEPPVALDDPQMGLILAVHMAALVAVDALAWGEGAAVRARSPDGVAGLTLYLLDREHLHWTRLYGDSNHSLDRYAVYAVGGPGPDEHRPTTRSDSAYRYSTPPPAMNRVVYAAALTGPVSRDGATRLLDRIELGHGTGPALGDHAYCYPPTEHVGAGVLEPLHPDRLAEDFLALTLPGHSADYASQDWAPDIVAEVLGTQSVEGFHEAAATSARAVTYLAAAAGRWPHVAATCLRPVLCAHPEAAIAAGSGALTALAALDHADIGVETLEAVEKLFPAGSHVDLDVGMAAVTQSLAAYRLGQIRDPAARARVHYNLGKRLKGAGRIAEATEQTRTAVALLRPLAEADPAPHLRDLISALNLLALCHSAVGELESALDRMHAALALCERLQAETAGESGEPDEASSALTALVLHNLSTLLGDVGRGEEALTAILEAVAVRRRLGPSARVPPESLAGSLIGLGACYAHLGRHEESLAPIIEAISILRPLARAEPAVHEPDLALVLNNLGMQLARLGRLRESLEAATESAALLRSLCDRNPAVLEPGFAAALTNLSARLAQNGRFEEAVAVEYEALALSRRLAAAMPAVHEPQLAFSLGNLGSRLSSLGRRQEAVATTSEAVEICRRWAAALPDVHETELAAALSNLAAELAELGQIEESLGPSREAIEIDRRLVARLPAAHEDKLAGSLTNLGIKLSLLGRAGEALVPSREAVKIRRRLAEQLPAAYSDGLATALNNYALRLREAGRHRESLAATWEAVEIERRLVELNPGAHEPALAKYLANLGIHLMATGSYEAAVAATRESADLRRVLAARLPDAFEPELAEVSANLAYRLSAVGRHAEALGPAEEATRILRRYAAAEPRAYSARLVPALTNLALALHGLGREDGALAAIEEAIELGTELVADNSEAHEPDLATAWNNRGTALLALRRPQEALVSYQTAISIRRRLAATLPAVHQINLAQSLLNISTVFGELERRKEQLDAATEAVAMLRGLGENGQGFYEADLASALNNQSIAFASAGRRGEALAAVAEAVVIRRALVQRNPDCFELILAKTLVHLSVRHIEMDQRQEALDAQQEAVNMLRALAQQQPDAHRRDLGVALATLSERHARLFQFKKAIAVAKEARAIAKSLPH